MVFGNGLGGIKMSRTYKDVNEKYLTTPRLKTHHIRIERKRFNLNFDMMMTKQEIENLQALRIKF